MGKGVRRGLRAVLVKSVRRGPRVVWVKSVRRGPRVVWVKSVRRGPRVVLTRWREFAFPVCQENLHRVQRAVGGLQKFLDQLCRTHP